MTRLHEEQTWTVADLRDALGSPDIPGDAKVRVRIIGGTGREYIVSAFLGLDLTMDRKTLIVGHT